jgi:phosphate-selective porin OprO/OprP
MGVAKSNVTAPKRLILAASIAVVCGGLAAPAHADMETLLDKLRAKGVLSEEEYQEMRTDVRAERREKALKEAQETEKAAKKAEGAATELTGRFKDGFSWESGDKENAIALSGRIHADYRQFDVNSGAGTTGTANSANTFDVRRAYLGVSGRVANDWTFEVVADLAQGTNGGTSFAQAMDVAWVNWGAYRGVQFRAGQFKMPMALEELTSSRFIDFTERSYVDQLAPAKERGAMIHGSPFTGVFYGVAASNGNGKNNNETTSVTDGKDIIGRLGANFAEIIGNKDMVLHVAGAYSDGQQAAGSVPSGRTEGRGIQFFTGPAIATEYDRKRTAAEVSLAWNQFKLQGEMLNANFKTTTGTLTDRDIDTSYAEAMWLITGEKYADAYRNGAYGAIKPNRAFKKGTDGWGAWELGLRYSKWDAGDFATTATSANGADAVTVGLKWIPNTNTRVYLNYIQTQFDQPINVVGGTADEEKAINMRLALYF